MNETQTIFRARFAGPVPPPGSPLLFNCDSVYPGGTYEQAVVGEMKLPLSVSTHIPYLEPQHEIELRVLLTQNASYAELEKWSKTLNDEFVESVIAAVTEENKKHLLGSIFLPCARATFVGIVASSQPRASIYSRAGLNHCDVIVQGVIPEMRFPMYTKDSSSTSACVDDNGNIYVGNTKIGKMVGNRGFVTSPFTDVVLRPDVSIQKKV